MDTSRSGRTIKKSYRFMEMQRSEKLLNIEDQKMKKRPADTDSDTDSYYGNEDEFHYRDPPPSYSAMAGIALNRPYLEMSGEPHTKRRKQDIFKVVDDSVDLEVDSESSELPGSIVDTGYRSVQRFARPQELPYDPNMEPLDIAAEDPFGEGSQSQAPEKPEKKEGQRGGGRMKNSISDIDIEELKKYRRLSGYTLFSLVNKKKYSSVGPGQYEPGVDSSKAMHRRLQELWGTLSEKSKREWKAKARRLMKQTQQQLRKESQAGNPEDVMMKQLKKVNEQLNKSRVNKYKPIDIAAHFKLVGDSLTGVARRLMDHRGPVGRTGTESVLLDTLMCALVPLVALTNQIPELATSEVEDISRESLNSLAFILPGIY